MDQANIVSIGERRAGVSDCRSHSQHRKYEFLLDALSRLGMGTSSRDGCDTSSGLHYPPGVLKASHRERGNQLT